MTATRSVSLHRLTEDVYGWQNLYTGQSYTVKRSGNGWDIFRVEGHVEADYPQIGTGTSLKAAREILSQA